LFSSEYGWKTEEILELTYREISWRVENIHKRSRKELGINATLHGRELQDEEGAVKSNGKDKVLDDDQTRAQDAALEEAKKRKAK